MALLFECAIDSFNMMTNNAVTQRIGFSFVHQVKTIQSVTESSKIRAVCWWTVEYTDRLDVVCVVFFYDQRGAVKEEVVQVFPGGGHGESHLKSAG